MSDLLFIHSTAPHGTINAQEALDAVLMGSAFTTCTLLFINEGVLQLVRDQSPTTLGLKNFSLTFGALNDYGVTGIYCRKDSMEKYQLAISDLVIDGVVLVDDEGARNLIDTHNKVLNF